MCVWTSQLIDFHEVILLGRGRHPFGRGAGFSEGSDRKSYVCFFCSLLNIGGPAQGQELFEVGTAF